MNTYALGGEDLAGFGPLGLRLPDRWPGAVFGVDVFECSGAVLCADGDCADALGVVDGGGSSDEKDGLS